MASSVSAHEFRAAMLAVEKWLTTPDEPQPDRRTVAAAVRLSARTLEAVAPGGSVEVRVPPFVAVQCIEGPRHTRGTPPNVVETDPQTWLEMVSGTLTVDEAAAAGRIELSGNRAAEIKQWLPLMRWGVDKTRSE